ncbi:MAG: chitobiase/beta-hexosaminidase C-terminal domain-containing protein [Acidimicrobiales bacterium]|nr:chitobiase/beta-hexosaminidase C-terminal domain-containing protein [Acidimicrobiales bacterium]
MRTPKRILARLLTVVVLATSLVVIPATQASAAPVSADDFNGSSINTSLWKNSVASGASVSHTGAQAALLVPAGFTPYSPWVSGNRTATIYQEITDDDLDVVAAFATVPNEAYQIQGILVSDAANSTFIRFDVYFDGTAVHAFAAEPSVSTTPLIDTVVPNANHAKFVRVAYDNTSGNWTLFTSDVANPGAWADHGTFNRPMDLGRAAVFSGSSYTSAGQPVPGHVAFVDYFGPLPIPGAALGSGADSQNPVNSTPTIEATSSSMKVTWTTNEPTISKLRVNGGTAVTAETDTGTYGLNHEVMLTGLAPATTYNLTITSTDFNGRTDSDGSQASTQSDDGSPSIEFFYGDEQTVGARGDAQRWFNLIGNVADANQITSITYKLNGGASTAVNIGPSPSGAPRRLDAVGDFNVDVLLSSLTLGENTIEVTARDEFGNETSRTATVIKVDGEVVPAVGIDWSKVDDLGSSVSPVDGDWEIQGSGLRSVAPGYDRIIAIGDTSWTSYEVSTTFTVNSVTADRDDQPSNGAGVGVFVRWNGHNDSLLSGSRPAVGFYPDASADPTPFGALMWLADPDAPDPDEIQILEADTGQAIAQPAGSALDFAPGSTYNLRAKVEGNTYSLKIWTSGTSEPGSWLTYTADGDDPNSGSLALVAHETDATFGPVVITPRDPSGSSRAATPSVSPSGGVVGQSTTVAVDLPAGVVVHYTTDGSTPTPLSPVYTSSVPVASTMKFIAYQADKDPSNVLTANFTVNAAPTVSAGADASIDPGATATLGGSVTDDGATGSLDIAWSKASGPGTVNFANAGAASTTATFSVPGTYVLVLTADDGQEVRFDQVTVQVGGDGYWLANGQGRVVAFGDLENLGDLSGVQLGSPVSAIAANRTRTGYWLAQQNGAITEFGSSPDVGGLDVLNITPAFPIVDMAATSTGQGVYLLGEDGGVFAFGDAEFYGSTGNIALDQPIVSMANHATGKGYWFVALDGGVFTFGPDAPFLGSVPEVVPYSQLAADVVAMAVTPSGNGYWLVAADGGIFAFGDAEFYGSIPGVLPPGTQLDQPIVGVVATPTGNGYWLVAADGGVFSFGDAEFFGADPTIGLVVGLA